MCAVGRVCSHVLDEIFAVLGRYGHAVTARCIVCISRYGRSDRTRTRTEDWWDRTHGSLTRGMCGVARAHMDDPGAGPTSRVHQLACKMVAKECACMYVRRMFVVVLWSLFDHLYGSGDRRLPSNRGRRHHALSSNEYVVALHLPRANGPSADTNSPVSRFPPLPPPAIAPCLFSRSFAVGRPVDGASLHVRAPSYQLDHVA